MTDTLVPVESVSLSVPSYRAHSFLVTRQDRRTRAYERLGVLTETADQGWEFRYFVDVAHNDDAAPLPGFDAKGEVARSPHLFPLFAQRVLSPARPDRAEVLAVLGLPESASAFEILDRNGGRRQGDTIELTRLPHGGGDGSEHLTFLVHGVRHRSVEEQRAIDTLSVGDPLRIVPEPSNEIDPGALLVSTADGVHIGWVPRPLTALLADPGNIDARVAHVNGRDTVPHLRLLAAIRGSLLSPELFIDPMWELVN